MHPSQNNTVRGAVCSALGGICWGFSGTCSQYLFSNFPVDALWLTCVRILSGGILLSLLSLPRGADSLRGILQNRRDLRQLICYGIFGLMLCQCAYMNAISTSNAATATVLQNLGVVLIMLYSCLRQRRRPNRTEALALMLALSGVFLLATGGNPTHMVLSPQGLFWGLAAAVALMSYMLLPQSLLERWDRGIVTGFGMLIGGIVLNVISRSWNFSVTLPPQGWAAVFAVVLFGTILSFSLLAQGIKDIGPVRASLMATTEPVAATVFSALWLKTTFAPTDYLGFAVILLAIFLLTKKAK